MGIRELTYNKLLPDTLLICDGWLQGYTGGYSDIIPSLGENPEYFQYQGHNITKLGAQSNRQVKHDSVMTMFKTQATPQASWDI